METHSVAQHLRVAADEYDVAIRRFIPHYDEMIATGIALLADLAPAAPRVLDLGGGTGALSEAVAARLPSARIELVDLDPAMLARAKERLGAHEGRVTFRHGSFLEPLPESDAIVASLALHHVHDLARKTELYGAAQRALAPEGVFLNLDAAVSADPVLRGRTFDRWAAFMGEHGIARDEALRHFADWAEEDRYFSVHEELAAMATAGFAHPECLWRRGPLAILVGRRA